jgi:hypothetical protein
MLKLLYKYYFANIFNNLKIKDLNFKNIYIYIVKIIY